jgi:hypothetical protein
MTEAVGRGGEQGTWIGTTPRGVMDRNENPVNVHSRLFQTRMVFSHGYLTDVIHSLGCSFLSGKVFFNINLPGYSNIKLIFTLFAMRTGNADFVRNPAEKVPPLKE